VRSEVGWFTLLPESSTHAPVAGVARSAPFPSRERGIIGTGGTGPSPTLMNNHNGGEYGTD